MQNILINYIVAVTKTCDEYLTVESTNGNEMEGSFRVYEIPGIPRSIYTEDLDTAKTLLDQGNWHAQFLLDNPDNPELEDSSLKLDDVVIKFVKDQDGEDYEDEGDTKVSFAYDGMIYDKSEIKNPPSDHDADELFDMRTSIVDAHIDEIELEIDSDTEYYGIDDIPKLLDKLFKKIE